MIRRIGRFSILVLGMTSVLWPQPGLADETGFQAAVDELRHVVGEWAVTTEEIDPDGSVARTLEGTYRFEWVVPDRVVTGRSDIPQLARAAALLFYVSESRQVIEMVSVSDDGRLWVMTGDLGNGTRYSQTYETQDGGSGQLRFTRYNVDTDRFESRMEYTSDGGETWAVGNRQVFRRNST
jgi:hypothetical protein